MQGETGVADEAINRIGVMLEQLGARFDLVLEAVTGFGGRIEGLRSELTEVDKMATAAGYTKPMTPLEDGIGDYVRSYLSQPDPYR